MNIQPNYHNHIPFGIIKLKMKPLVNKLKPTAGFANIFHTTLLILMPIALFIFVRLGFFQLAFSLVLLSKWRMVAVKPRFWPSNIRANSVDIIVGLSIVIFMIHSDSAIYQLLWVAIYALWLTVIKPAASTLIISVQAFIGQLFGLFALYLVWRSTGPLYGLTLLTGIICYFAARHFFDSFDEPYAKLLSYVWAYFGASLAWLLAHWLIYYRFLSQPTLLLSTLGYGLAVLYYLDHNNRLSKSIRRQFVVVMIVIVAVVLVFSNWGAKVV